MPTQSGPDISDTPLPRGRVHVVGAGPVGLLLTALLQSMEGYSVHSRCWKRRIYCEAFCATSLWTAYRSRPEIRNLLIRRQGPEAYQSGTASSH
jgi:hypothetical protein